MQSEQIAAIAAGLTKAQREALDRAAARKAWIDARSGYALVRKGLLKQAGFVSDELLGNFIAWQITPLGLAVRAELMKEQPK